MKNNDIKYISKIAAQKIYSKIIDRFLEKVEKGKRQCITKKCGIDNSTVTRWLKGKRKETPRLERFLSLVYGLEISAVEIINLMNEYKKLPDIPQEESTLLIKKKSL